MEKHDIKKAQGGFTLIEIIAVLVILGILAAVAVPRFMNLQDDAVSKTADGIGASVLSGLSLNYAQTILAGTPLPSDVTISSDCEDYASMDQVDDFSVTCAGDNGLAGVVTVTINHDRLDTGQTYTWTSPENGS
jgi:MSHA pilin protein MshA